MRLFVNLQQQIKSLRSLYLSHQKALLLLITTWGVYFLITFIHVWQFKPDGLYANHPFVWADWSLHLAMALMFAYQDPKDWFSYHPMYADGGLNYTFLTNLISGILMRSGWSVYAAFVIPSLIYSFFLLIGMYGLFYLILKSKPQSLVAISIFFLSSGPGFIYFFSDLLNQNPLLVPDPDLDYSRLIQYQWYTGNFFSFFISQRSLLLGMTLSIWALVGLIYILASPLETRKHRAILPGSALLIGILPIAHLHSFLAMIVVTGLLCVVSYTRWSTLLSFYIIPAACISLITYMTFLAGGIETTRTIQWYPGFTAQGGFFPWIIMWIKLWGVMLPMAIAGFVLLHKRSPLVKAFFLSFFLIFAITNLILFQYFAWDNSKLFLWSYFGFSGLAAVVLSRSWQQGRRDGSRFIALLLTFLLTFTGVLELIRFQRIIAHPIPMMSRAEMQLAEQIRATTAPQARFLTAPIHNHPIMMWAVRPILLGYGGWVRSYGFLSDQMETDVRVMYEDGTQAAALLAQYRISYVVIGPAERQHFNINDAYYQTYPVAFQNQQYQVYDVRSLWQNVPPSEPGR